MTDREPLPDPEPDGLEVHADFFRPAGSSWERVRTAGGTADVVFAIECRGENPQPASMHELVLELWRGPLLRDRRVHAFQMDGSAPWRATYRLIWGNRSDASSRLRCRVQLDNRHVGWWELLVQHVPVDAQGRLSSYADRGSSNETMMLYQREYAALLGRDPDGPRRSGAG